MDVRVGLWRKLSTKKMDAFELWCWRRLLRVPWTARRSNQSILKEISPGCSLEGLMLNLKLQYFGHLMQRVDSLEKTLMLGGTGGRRRRGRQRMRWLDGITDSMGMSLSKLRSLWWTGRPGVLLFMGLQRVTTERLNWTIKIRSSLMTPHMHLQYIKYLTVYVGPPFSIKPQLVYYTVMMFYNTIWSKLAGTVLVIKKKSFLLSTVKQITCIIHIHETQPQVSEK